MIGTILTALWQRVVVAYKSTLIGLAFVAADAIITSLEVAQLPPWAHYAVGIVASILALYRPKAPPVAALVP
jgi:hypothetical protein